MKDFGRLSPFCWAALTKNSINFYHFDQILHYSSNGKLKNGSDPPKSKEVDFSVLSIKMRMKIFLRFLARDIDKWDIFHIFFVIFPCRGGLTRVRTAHFFEYCSKVAPTINLIFCFSAQKEVFSKFSLQNRLEDWDFLTFWLLCEPLALWLGSKTKKRGMFGIAKLRNVFWIAVDESIFYFQSDLCLTSFFRKKPKSIFNTFEKLGMMSIPWRNDVSYKRWRHILFFWEAIAANLALSL